MLYYIIYNGIKVITMKRLIKVFLVIAIITGGLLSIKLVSEVFGPSLKKYYSVDR